jgi:ABC-type nitrate/sulfonate/bicarbonate transport system substrate-binding protein
MTFRTVAGRTVQALGVIVAILLLGTAGAAAQPLKTINVGMQPIVNGPIYIAIKEKYYEKMGLKVNLVKFTSGPAQFAALAGGQVDLAWGGMGAFLLAKANGQDLNFFAVFMDYNPLEGIAVPGAGPVHSVRDLAGKKVALVRGSDAHYGMLKALQANGMGKDAVQILNMAPPQQAAALEAGDVDAMFAWEPFLTPLTKKGARIIFHNSELHPGPAFLGWAGHKAWLEKNKDVIVKLLKGWDMGLKKMHEDPELAISTAMEFTGMSVDQAHAIQKQLVYYPATAAIDPKENCYWAKGSKLNRLMHDFLAFGKEYGLVKGDTDVDGYVMTQFMEAVKSGK